MNKFTTYSKELSINVLSTIALMVADILEAVKDHKGLYEQPRYSSRITFDLLVALATLNKVSTHVTYNINSTKSAVIIEANIIGIHCSIDAFKSLQREALKAIAWGLGKQGLEFSNIASIAVAFIHELTRFNESVGEALESKIKIERINAFFGALNSSIGLVEVSSLVSELKTEIINEFELMEMA